MSLADLPDPTLAPGARHPRDTLRLVGQTRAEEDFLDAFNMGRLHHGWLLTGPRGVGKATLAWRITRFLMTQPEDNGPGLFGEPEQPTSLDPDPNHPALSRIHAGSEPGIFVLKRGANATESALSQDIRVDEVRKLRSFLHLSAAEGGRGLQRAATAGAATSVLARPSRAHASALGTVCTSPGSENEIPKLNTMS